MILARFALVTPTSFSQLSPPAVPAPYFTSSTHCRQMLPLTQVRTYRNTFDCRQQPGLLAYNSASTQANHFIIQIMTISVIKMQALHQRLLGPCPDQHHLPTSWHTVRVFFPVLLNEKLWRGPAKLFQHACASDTF